MATNVSGKALVSHMKKFLVLLLVICMCLPAFAACSTLHGEEDKGANIQMFLTSFPHTLDPATVQLDASTSLLFNLIYQPLTRIDENGKVVGALAKNWYAKYDKQDQVYKMYFELNETWWSDGILVQAYHVADAWTRILSPENESPYASLLFPIRNAVAYKSGLMTQSDLGVYAEGDDLLCVEFEQEYDVNLFAEAVSCIALSPMRVEIIDRAAKNNPKDDKAYDRLQDWDKNAALIVCNGPYRVQGYEEGTKLVLERNKYFYRNDEEDGALDESVIPFRLTCIYQETTLSGFDIAADAKTDEYNYQYNKFINGTNYFMSAFNAASYEPLKEQADSKRLLSTFTYFFNCKDDSVTGNPLVRQALSAALDRTKMAQIMGRGETPSTGFVPNGVFDKTVGSDFRTAGGSIYSVTADTNKAKELLKQANVSSGTINLTYLIPWTSQLYSATALHVKEKDKVTTYNPFELLANYTKEAWEALGFTVKLKGVYADTYQETISKGDWDVIGVDYSINSTDAFAYLAPFATKFSGNIVSVELDADPFTPHYTHIQDADFDALLESVVYDSNRETRTAKLHEAETKLNELCPATAVFQYQRNYVISDNLSKISSDNWYGYFDLEDLRLDDYLEVNSKENEESLARAEQAKEAE